MRIVGEFIPPILTTTERDAITSPDQWSVIINSTVGAIQFWNGVTWQSLSEVDITGHDYKNLLSTGLVNGGDLSINVDNTKFDIADGDGIIVDNWTDPDNPVITTVTWTGLTAQTVPDIATQDASWVMIDSAGLPVFTVNLPTNTERRDNILIGRLVHPNNVNLSSVSFQPDGVLSPLSQVRDLWNGINLVNLGNTVSNNGANLEISKSSGTLIGEGINQSIDPKDPHTKSLSSIAPVTFQHTTQNGPTGGFVTNIDVANYDVGGVVTPIPGGTNHSSNFRVYLFPSNVVAVHYGQNWYNSLSEAISNIQSESLVESPTVAQNAILIGVISVTRTATDLSNPSQARFIGVSKFGETAGGAAGISTTSLQQAYDNGVEPEVLTNDIRGTVTLRRGTTGGDADDVLEVQNNAGTKVATVTGEGVFKGGHISDSTGLLTGGVLQAGTGGFGVTNLFSITDGSGQIVDINGKKTNVTWAGLTDLAITFLATNLISFIGIDSAGTVIQQTTPFSAVQARSTIVLGVLVHVNFTVLDTVNNEQEIAYNPMSSLHDAMQSIGFFNISGNVFSANGPNMNINKSVGSLFKMGSNYDTDVNNPHQRTLPALTPAQFQYRFSDGSSGILTETNIDPDNLDDGAGGLTAISANRWSIQRIYCFTSNNVKIQRGVQEYSTLDAAVSGIATEPYITEPSIEANGLLRGWLVVKQGATALNGADALFLAAPKFGTGNAGATGAATDLQTAYDNSTANPEILTNATGGPVTVRRGSAADTDKVLQTQNGGGTETFGVTGEGKVNALDYNGVPLTTAGSALNFLNEQGNYVTAPGGGSLTSVTNAGMLATPTPSVGDQVFNTTWGQVYTWDGDVWINPNLVKCVNGSAIIMAEGYVVIQDGAVAADVTTTTTASSIAVIGVVKDVYGGGDPGDFVTVAVSGEHNVLYSGAVNIGEGAISDNVAGQATATGTGATGTFGIARGSKSPPGTALILTWIQPTERF